MTACGVFSLVGGRKNTTSAALINAGTVILLYLLYYIFSHLSKRCKGQLRNPAKYRYLPNIIVCH